MAEKLELKHSSSPMCVALQRLKGKKDNVIEQLKLAEEYVDRLRSQKNDVILKMNEECSIVEREVNLVKEFLEGKRAELIEELQLKRNVELESLSSSIELANVAISKTNKVVGTSTDLEAESSQESFFAAYSLVNNSLEERFIDLLLLLDGQQISIKLEEMCSIDLSVVVEALKVVSLNCNSKKDDCDSHLECESSVPEHELEQRSIQEDNEDLLVSSGLNSDTEEVKLGVDSKPIEIGPPQLYGIELSPDTSIEAHVTEVYGLQNFTVQPVGTELVAMMEDMGEHYSKDYCDCVQYVQRVGDFCCAKFTEDNCWYRAQVVEVVESDDLQACVNYVDYGNEEMLPFTQLRPLDPKFCALPCQAINCSLKNICPPNQPELWWEPILCDWFSSLLLGKNVQITVSESLDVTLLEVFLPYREVERSAFLNVVLEDEFVNKDLIPLSLFMGSIGLPCVNDGGKRLNNVDILNIAHLPPLIVKLDAAQEFTCLMSHIADQMHFYVHPVQEHSVHNMNSINSEIGDHYSIPANCTQLPPDSMKCGSLCCIFSSGFQQWCRGVILSLKSDQSGKPPMCLILFLDYGGLEWMGLSNIFILIKSLCVYPPQVLCCCFEEITVDNGGTKANGSSKKTLRNPDFGCFNTGCSDSKSSECIDFIKRVTDKKQLFVVVKGKDMNFENVLLVHSLKCVLPVNLYDTTGESDLHINKELMKKLSLLSGKKSKPMNNHENSITLQDWNPMEDDYLSKRNIYKIDDEDCGLALEGYKSTSRICHYFASGKRCYRGESCPFLHIQEGLSNKQMENAVVDSGHFLQLPKKNDWVVVVVTAIISSTRFYIQLPLGCRSPLTLEFNSDQAEDSDSDDYYLLLEEMTDYYNQQVFNERDVVLPHTGEIVAAHYMDDGYWYRGRVIDSMNDTLSVFFVDYGNIATVTDENVRSLNQEFTTLPFQAIECFLPDLKSSPHFIGRQHQARECLTDCVQNKVLVARVDSVEANGSLGLELFSNDEDGVMDININKALVECDVLRVENIIRVSQDCKKHTLMRPG